MDCRLQTSDYRRGLAVALTAALVLIASASEARQGRGRLSGCVIDSVDSVLPGVTVLAGRNGKITQAVTDSAGCYELGLPPGSYTVFACLPGFVTVGRDDVAIVNDREALVDFQLRVAPVCECIHVPTLAALRKLADVAVRVRLVSQKLGPDADVGAAIIHTAQILATWKTDPRVTGPTISFQEELGSVCQPYEVGREMVLFLTWNARHDAFEVVNGVNGAFTLEAGKVTWAGIDSYLRKPVADFVAELDALREP
jgi:hypothetical protein